MKNVARRIIFWAITLVGIIILSIIIINAVVLFVGNNSYNDQKAQAVLILGAKVYQSGRLSHMLRDRADTAVEIYQSGHADKILVSGDHGRMEYNEVGAIKDYLLEQGVPDSDIFLDHAGFDTYDSLYRASYIFQIKSIIVCTQKFHLPRAVFIGRMMGMQTYGAAADKRSYSTIFYYHIREIPARVKSFFDSIFKIKPRYLGDPIPIGGDGQISWE